MPDPQPRSRELPVYTPEALANTMFGNHDLCLEVARRLEDAERRAAQEGALAKSLLAAIGPGVEGGWFRRNAAVPLAVFLGGMAFFLVASLLLAQVRPALLCGAPPAVAATRP